MNDKETLACLLGGLVPPEPPGELHGEVMQAAVAALAREAPRDLWTRLWESRPLRLAWAAVVLLLLLGNLVAPRATSTFRMRGIAPAAAADELDSIARLPRIDLETLPSIGSVPSAVGAEPQPVQTPHQTKESRS